MKKCLSILIAVVLVTCFFTGCNPTNPDVDSSVSSQTESSSINQAAEPAATGEKKTVTIWTINRHDAEFTQAKIDAYNASNPHNIEVKYDDCNWSIIFRLLVS